MAETQTTDRKTDEYTHQLEQLLQRQLTRIRQRFLLHGTGSFVVVFLLAVVAYYPLDRYLHLPGTVRVFLSLGLAVYLGYLIQRFILYPIRHNLARRDVALAIEERFPELRQKLISAVQLGRSAAAADESGPRNQSRAMIDLLLADAAEHADRIPHQQLLNPRETAKVWTGAMVLLLGVVSFAVANPGVSAVFVQRIFGMNAAYPRDTYLVVEQPAPGAEPNPEFRVEEVDGVIRVTLAAGGDLPVLVRADGVTPREVNLVVSGGRGLPPKIAMAARSDRHFKYTFRRVSTQRVAGRRVTHAFSFYPTGGDDLGGGQRVDVSVIFPPRVENVRATITYPAYTRKPPPPLQSGSIEALIGSKVQFDVTTTNKVVTAKIKLLEAGQDIELKPIEIVDDGGMRTAYRCTFTITRSDRYQVVLLGEDGLHNPRPDTYHIVATPDHPPIGKILAPLDDGLNVSLPDGIVPVRISARDDYGLTDITMTLEAPDGKKPLVRQLFTPNPIGHPTGEPVKRQIVLTFLDLAQAEFKEHAQVGGALVLSVSLSDNREPEANTKSIGPRLIRIVGETDLLRLISSHFRRIRDNVDQNYKLILDRNDRLEEIIEEIGNGTPLDKLKLGITTVEIAQGRIRSAAGRIHLELMRAFNFHLFNRLETSAHAPAVLQLYRTFHEQVTEPKSFFPEFYRDLANRRLDGRLGAMDKALDPILFMTKSADRIAAELAPDSLRLLTEARVAQSNKDAVAALEEASTKQRAIIVEFKSLRDRLDRWNEFQDVITNTRTLLDQQRDVKARTKILQGGKDK